MTHVREQIYLTHWRVWYREQKPELFDLPSFECFIQNNAQILIETGVVAFVRNDYYIVSPDFDRYIAITVNLGLLRSILCSRIPSTPGCL